MASTIPTTVALTSTIRAAGVKDLRSADRRSSAYEAIRGLVDPRLMPILAPKKARTVRAYAEEVVDALRYAKRVEGIIPAPVGLH